MSPDLNSAPAFEKSLDDALGTATASLTARSIAILVPCHNEAATITDIVQNFRSALPTAAIYVYNNNSVDDTVKRARDAGAIVRNEPIKGKGNVVRRMFADVEADVYVLVDGDDTYDARAAPKMIHKLIDENLDMVNGARVTKVRAAYRPGHRLGNAVLTGLVANIFGKRIVDMLSGYRVFSHRFVKSFPALSRGFEIETELTVHALELRMPVAEVATIYKERPQGSSSKLRTFHDGFRILCTIAVLVKEERPLAFFSWIAVILAALSLFLAWPVVDTYVRYGVVPRLPTAVLSTGIMLLSFSSFFCGLILDTVTRGRAEMKRMFYLRLSSPGDRDA